MGMRDKNMIMKTTTTVLMARSGFNVSKKDIKKGTTQRIIAMRRPV
jgi:hypothetical protein